MYELYLDSVLMPVTPEKIQWKYKGGNKTLNLINEGEVNQIKKGQLTEVSFDLLLPAQPYSFACYKDGNFLEPKYFLLHLEKLREKKKPFTLRLLRQDPTGKGLFDSAMQATLEDYTVTEDAKEGLDIKVSVELKQYRAYGVTRLTVKKDGKKATKSKAAGSGSAKKKAAPDEYVIKSGDTLWAIAKKYLGNGNQWKILYQTNKTVIEKAAKNHGYSSSASGHWIFPGTKIRIPKG